MLSIWRPSAVCHEVPGLISCSSSHGLIFFSANLCAISRTAGLSSLLWHIKTSKISALGPDPLTLPEFLASIPKCSHLPSNARQMMVPGKQNKQRSADRSYSNNTALRFLPSNLEARKAAQSASESGKMKLSFPFADSSSYLELRMLDDAALASGIVFAPKSYPE
jgi:hypothetical protein